MTMEKPARLHASLVSCLVRHPRDWSLDHRDAWLWGIICGWDDDSLQEVAIKHQWPPADIEKLRSLRKALLAADMPCIDDNQGGTTDRLADRDHGERLQIMAAGIRYGYLAGHEDTVEGRYGDPDAVAADYAPEILSELALERPTQREVIDL